MCEVERRVGTDTNSPVEGLGFRNGELVRTRTPRRWTKCGMVMICDDRAFLITKGFFWVLQFFSQDFLFQTDICVHMYTFTLKWCDYPFLASPSLLQTHQLCIVQLLGAFVPHAITLVP